MCNWNQCWFLWNQYIFLILRVHTEIRNTVIQSNNLRRPYHDWCCFTLLKTTTNTGTFLSWPSQYPSWHIGVWTLIQAYYPPFLFLWTCPMICSFLSPSPSLQNPPFSCLRCSLPCWNCPFSFLNSPVVKCECHKVVKHLALCMVCWYKLHHYCLKDFVQWFA